MSNKQCGVSLMAGTGVELRLGILRDTAMQQIIKPLQSHGWEASISGEFDVGEYLVVSAKKMGDEHKVALMYSSATDNKHYKTLDAQVSHIFTNGALYMVDSFAYGIKAPVLWVGEFFNVLVGWNKSLSPDVGVSARAVRPKQIRRITGESPVSGVWAHLGQYASVQLARRLVERRAEEALVGLTVDQLESKSSGVAFAIRSAADYFRGAPHESLNKRVLSLYYGTLSLAFAEMLASPHGSTDLDQVEGMTKQGHGLFALAPESDDFGSLTVGVLASGFFPQWVSFLGHETSSYPKSKAKALSDFENQSKFSPGTFVNINGLLSAMPELGELFGQVSDMAPSWVDVSSDMDSHRALHGQQVGSSYVFFVDPSRGISKSRLESLPWPIAELSEAGEDEYESGNRFRARIDHPGFKSWWDVLPVRRSPYDGQSALILPVLGGVFEYRAISLAILYALSILVRYMPSAWRRVEGGDWDQHLVLMRTALDVFERVLPQEFLGSIADEHIYTGSPGGFF